MQSRLQTSNEAKDVIKKWIHDSADNIRVSMPAKVVSYDAATNRASVKPFGTYTTKDFQEIEYPVIHSVPMQFPCGVGGTAGVTFPIKAGDGCIVIFADREIEQFLSGSFSDDMRSHSMNDAYAIPGLYSQAVPTQTTNADDMCFFNDGSLAILNGSMFKCTLQNGSTFLLAGNTFTFTMADGTTATVGGGDIVVNGISLVHHVHSGVDRGSSNTDEPVG
jgi:hypothetical protein